MDVRRATRDDLVAVGRVADAAHWEAFSGLLGPATISALLQRDFAPGPLRRRLLSGGVMVAEEQGRVLGFADAAVDGGLIRLSAVATDAARRRSGVAAALLEAVRGLAPDLPVSADVLLGCLPVEGYLEAQGFVPGEILEISLFGEPAVARRWWLAPP